jgi:hypothetical protein
MAEEQFEHQQGFARSTDEANVRLGRFELMYEELFSEVIEDGVITPDERKRLETMADNFGLDRARLRRLEQALQAAYASRNRTSVTDLSDLEAAPMSVAPLQAATDPMSMMLQHRVKVLEDRVKELEHELADARAHVNVEVDLSEFKAAATGNEEDYKRRLRLDPRDVDALEGLFRVTPEGQRLGIAHALEYLGSKNADALALVQTDRSDGLIRPNAALSRDAWQRLLYHPDTEPLIGEIFSVVVSAVMLGKMSALRRDKKLDKLSAEGRQDPEKTTVQAVRSVHWAASILGLGCPPMYLDPKGDFTMRVALSMPAAITLGHKALSGRNGSELAFMAGRHLAYHREEHFLKVISPTMRGLEDIFLAALSIGNPGLPMNANVKEIVVPIAKAIEPVLDASQIDRLRGHFLRFVELGGRANLLRWSNAVDRTCNRAGFLLSGDLRAAHTVMEFEDPIHLQENMDDLLTFVTSDRLASLQKQIGLRG